MLTDFGLARAEVRGKLGPQEELSGTPAYMAPEQIVGGQVDARTDLYALGCVLYEMLVGELPYPRATTFDAAKRFCVAPIPDPRVHCVDVPLWLVQILRRLLAKEARERYRSASAVHIALLGPRRIRPWRALTLVAVTFVALVCAWGWYRSSRYSRWHPEVQHRLSYEEAAGDPVISPDGTTLAYMANREGDWRLYTEPLSGGQAQPIARTEYLNVIRWTRNGQALLGVTEDLRAVRIAISNGVPKEIARNVIALEDCAGRLVLATSGTEQCPQCVRILAYEGAEPLGPGRELARLPHGRSLHELRCDRRGQRLAYTTVFHKAGSSKQSDIYTLEIQGGEPRRLTLDSQSNRFPIFAPDGKSIIFSSLRSGSSELWEIAVAGGEPTPLTADSGRLPMSGSTRVIAGDISPDGKTLVYGEEVYSVPSLRMSSAVQDVAVSASHSIR